MVVCMMTMLTKINYKIFFNKTNHTAYPGGLKVKPGCIEGSNLICVQPFDNPPTLNSYSGRASYSTCLSKPLRRRQGYSAHGRSRRRTVLFFILSFFIIPIIFAVDVGSDSTPSRQSHTIFPQADGDNRMRGFAVFEGGFTLENQNTTCIFDSFFPISGAVDMRCGTLHLNKDIYFDGGVSLTNMGSFQGGELVAEFSESVTWFGAAYDSATSVSLNDVTFIFNNSIEWEMTTTVMGTSSFIGNGSKINLSGSGNIVVDTGAQLTLENIKISGVSSENFKCEDDTASFVFRDCEIALSNDLEFANGSISFYKENVFTGTNKFLYSGGVASTINSNSILKFDNGTTFSYAPSVADRSLLAMTDDTSYLYLNGCTLYATQTSPQFTKGQIIIDNNVTFSSEGIDNSELITFGDGSSSANDTIINVMAGAEITVYGGIYDNNVG